MAEPVRRRNGCSQPPSKYQAIAMGLIFGSLGLFYGLVVPFSPNEKAEAFLWAYTVIAVVGLGCLCYVELIDPIRSENQKQGGGSPAETRYCDYCANPKPMKLTTKHCRLCNKCVSHFDHHCVWLDTCIGSANYWPFFALLVCCVAAQALHLGAAASLFDDDHTRARATGLIGSYEAYAVILALSMLPPLVVIIPVSILLGFHFYIKAIGTTTYVFVTRRRNQKLDIHAGRSRPRMSQAERDRRRERQIKAWKREQAERKTRQKRKDLGHVGTVSDRRTDTWQRPSSGFDREMGSMGRNYGAETGAGSSTNARDTDNTTSSELTDVDRAGSLHPIAADVKQHSDVSSPAANDDDDTKTATEQSYAQSMMTLITGSSPFQHVSEGLRARPDGSSPLRRKTVRAKCEPLSLQDSFVDDKMTIQGPKISTMVDNL